MRARLASILIHILLVGILPFVVAPQAKAANSKATICHRTNSVTNPYRLITVSRSSISGNKGHNGHNVASVWTPTRTKAQGWGDIIPGGLNWNLSGAQDIYYGVTKTASGTPACRSMTFSQFYAAEKAAGQTDAQIAEDLDDGLADEDKAVLATFGGGCTKFSGCSTSLATISNNSKVIAAVTTFPTNVTATSATLNGYVKTDSNSIRYYFQYSTDGTWAADPIQVPLNAAGPLTTNTTTNVSSNITGLTSGTTYYYRIIAEYTSGGAVQQVSGDLVSFVASSTQKYVVKYDANGGTDGLAPVDSKLYPSNTATKVLSNYGNLVKNGRAFIGWSLSAGSALRANLILPGTDVNLVARKASKLYSVFARQTFLKVSSTPSYVNTNYNGGDNITVQTSDITLYAQYSTSFTVTYNGNTNGGGTAPTDATSYSSGANVTVAGNTGSLTKTGYSFGGWCTTQPDPGAACSGTTRAAASTFSITSDVVLYAIWNANKYVYNGNTGSGTAPAEQIYAGATLSARANTFSLNTYSFLGWCKDQLAPGTTSCSHTRYTPGSALPAPETSTVSLFAIWSQAAALAVTYDSQGGSSVPQTDFLSGETISLPSAPTRTGYTFAGWYTQGSGGTRVGGAGGTYDPQSQNRTLYAQWTAIVYTITYFGNTNTGGTAPNAANVNYNDSHTVLAQGNLQKTGFTFGGWNIDAGGAGTNYLAGDTFTVTADVELYAKWNANSYVVSYNGNSNDGGSAPANQSKVHDVNLTLASNSGSLTRSGFTFNGWNTAANGSGTAYAAGATYSLNAGLVLYAQWTPVSQGGGTPAPAAPPPPPVITAISASLLCATTNDVLISGSAFEGARVTFDGAAVVIKQATSSSLLVTLPAASLGIKTLVVTTPNGTATTSVNYLSSAKPKFQPIRIPYLSQGVAINLDLLANDTLRYKVSGRLPSGVTFNETTGLISGTPTENGVYVLNIVAVGVCGEDNSTLELDVDAPTPNAMSHRINFLPGTCELTDAAKASFEQFIEKIKGLSPRNIIPDIYISGGSKNSDPNSPIATCRQESICDLLLIEDLTGDILTDVFSGAENRIEIIVYWPRPNDDL